MRGNWNCKHCKASNYPTNHTCFKCDKEFQRHGNGCQCDWCDPDRGDVRAWGYDGDW